MSSRRVSPVEMSKQDFKKVGHYLIDLIAEFYDRLGEGPVTTAESPTALRELVGNGSLPENGLSAEAIMERAADLMVNHSLFNGHPKFLGYITSSPTQIGALADLLAAAINPNVGANILSPMATEIEKQTIRWLCDFIGVSPEYGGIMVSGGNMANFTAFVAARTKAERALNESAIKPDKPKLVVYCSKATHTWVEQAVKLFGIGKQGIRWIEQDESGKLRTEQLTKKIEGDIEDGCTPFLVVGNAGDVSTGVVDDLRALATVCKTFKLWFHIDGAYGIPAAVVPELKTLFDGIEEADSIALDPHKWLYSPLEAGCTLVKDPTTLVDTYSTHPVYFNFDGSENQAHNFYEYGFQNSRGFRALKVWAALQQVGRTGYVKMIREDISLSQLFFDLAQRHPELEAVTQNLSITTLRYVPNDGSGTDEVYLNKLNETLLNTLQQQGEVFLSNAVLHDKYCLRGCIVNFRTSEKDIEEIVSIIVREGRKIHASINTFSISNK